MVADAVETDSTHERAVEAFLGDRLQAVLVPDAAHALRGIRYLQESGAGRGAFLPLASARTKADCGPLREIAAQEPKVKGLLSDFYPRERAPRRPHQRGAAGRARGREPRGRARRDLRARVPVPCVTLAGETARGAMVEGGRGVKGLLAPRREVREVAERHAVAEAQLLLARARAWPRSGRGRPGRRGARRALLEERIHDAEKDLVAIQHDLGVADEADQRLDRKAAVLETERGQAEQEKGAAALKLAEIEQALGRPRPSAPPPTTRCCALASGPRRGARRHRGGAGPLVRGQEPAGRAARARGRGRGRREAARAASTRSCWRASPPPRAGARRCGAAGAAPGGARRGRERCSPKPWPDATASRARWRWPRTRCASSATSSRAASRP